MSKVIKCARCKRRCSSPYSNNGWNSVWEMGRFSYYLCPDCQTPEENAEAEANWAGFDYASGFFDNEGRWYVPPKVGL